MNGAKGYLAKVVRRTKDGGKLHRTAEESSAGRWRKKLLDKSNWFKDKKRKTEDEISGEQSGPGLGNRRQGDGETRLKSCSIC